MRATARRKVIVDEEQRFGVAGPVELAPVCSLEGRGARLLDSLFRPARRSQSMGRVRPQASTSPYRQQPQKRFSVRF